LHYLEGVITGVTLILVGRHGVILEMSFSQR
jgi:hypothetical protein